ncbi:MULTISPECIES: fasciclin domain-containing protein [Butyricimonas]|uniref:fasciclin domain-containing protein n=1 Tax=Butyricimonas TaxID=574697 RepID=UPI000382CA71|nr:MULTISPECIES: fasciclin domain-containing protein [Butyricimonas]
MKKILWAVLIAITTVACQTDYNMDNTGLAKGKFAGTMYEYFHSDSYNWDSLLIMIDKAGLQNLFNGREAGYEEITFWGPTNHSIRRWMLEAPKPGEAARPRRLEELTPEECRKFVMAHVVKGKTMLNDIPRGTVSMEGTSGGMVMTGGDENNEMWVYTEQLPYNGVIGVGAVVIKIRSLRTKTDIDIASCNIEPTTGVVHSLHPNYTLGEL